MRQRGEGRAIERESGPLFLLQLGDPGASSPAPDPGGDPSLLEAGRKSKTAPPLRRTPGGLSSLSLSYSLSLPLSLSLSLSLSVTHERTHHRLGRVALMTDQTPTGLERNGERNAAARLRLGFSESPGVQTCQTIMRVCCVLCVCARARASAHKLGLLFCLFV